MGQEAETMQDWRFFSFEVLQVQWDFRRPLCYRLDTRKQRRERLLLSGAEIEQVKVSPPLSPVYLITLVTVLVLNIATATAIVLLYKHHGERQEEEKKAWTKSGWIKKNQHCQHHFTEFLLFCLVLLHPQTSGRSSKSRQYLLFQFNNAMPSSTSTTSTRDWEKCPHDLRVWTSHCTTGQFCRTIQHQSPRQFECY